MGGGFFTGQIWQRLAKLHEWQGFSGNIAAILFAVALIFMADGLIASMRKGSNSLDLLPGQSLALSGPAASKNPLLSDVVARFTPPDCPLRFRLEGFFTGYWFGSGMWRGEVTAEPEQNNAVCRLLISFRGMPASSAQNYEVRLFPDSEALREASFSLVTRYLGLNSFPLAATCGLFGLFAGIFTYVLGRIYQRALWRLQIYLVYSPAADGRSFLCVSPKKAFESIGESFYVYSDKGVAFGKASALEWKKGKLRLQFADFKIPPDGSLVSAKGLKTRNSPFS